MYEQSTIPKNLATLQPMSINYSNIKDFRLFRQTPYYIDIYTLLWYSVFMTKSPESILATAPNVGL